MAVFRAGDDTEVFRPMHFSAEVAAQAAQAEQAAQTKQEVEREVQARLQRHAARIAEETRAELQPRIRALEQAIPNTESLIEAVAAVRREQLVKSRNDIAELVETLTRRIVGDAFALDRRALLGVVDQAIGTVAMDEILFLRVPQDCEEVVRAHVHPDVAARVVGVPHLTDACQVVTAEARVETSLDEVLDQLSGLVREWAASPQ